MSVESATYISQLVPANPAGSDPVSDGATHLRLVKSVLQAQFPNLGGAAVTSTAAQLSGALCPIGGVIMWSGSIATIPAGWVICNGGTYTRTDGAGSIVAPNLYDRFVVGAGVSYGVGAIGGAVAVTPSGAVGYYALTISDIPAHGHGVNDPGHAHGVNDPGHTHLYSGPVAGTSQAGSINPVISSASNQNTAGSSTGISIAAAGTGISIQANGSGGAHTHSFSGNSQENRPPFYALAFIMKI